MTRTNKLMFLAGLIAVSVISLRPQEKAKYEPAAPSSGFRAEYIHDLNDIEKKVVDLAGAMPQDKYAWRPSEGVRSVGEVYAHIAGANYYLPTMAGVKAPEGYNSDEGKKETDKSKIIENLKESFEHVRHAILSASDADLDKPSKFFGDSTTVRGIWFSVANHTHEHLGQAIAYARMIGVVPPWTAAEQARQKEKSKK